LIGIFDSGIGGLTVVRAVRSLLPEFNICYFGDTARTPYGTKSPETVTRYALENTRMLIERGARIIVVACNTASSVAFETLCKNFDLPIIEVISPAVEAALSDPRAKNIGIIGTRATIGSGIYEREIGKHSPEKKVFSIPCPLIVPLVEEGWQKRPETRMIIKKYLHPLKVRQIDTLILGCTHYPVVKDIIQSKIGKRVRVIDSSLAVVDSLARFLEKSPEIKARLGRGGTWTLMVSDVTEQFRKTAHMILNTKVELTHVRL